MTLVEKDKKQLPAWLLERIGDPEQVRRELRAFQACADWYQAEWERLLEAYEGRWIAIYECGVRAVAETLDDLLTAMHDLGLPRGHVLIEHPHRRSARETYVARR
jgi:hypothetical protein